MKTSIRNFLRANKIVRWCYFDAHLADIPVLLNFKSFRSKAMKNMEQFLPQQELQDATLCKKIYNDIRRCYYKYKATPQEYFLFDFKNKDEKERASYLSDMMIMKYVANKTGRMIHDKELNDKFHFYRINKDFFKRKAICFDSDTLKRVFCEFTNNTKRIIVKPNKAALGTGVKIFDINSEEEQDIVFNMLKDSGMEYIIEEVIVQNSDMGKWNESSVNTIRVNSFLNRGKFEILCPFIRTGRKGSIVDNGGQGGIFAAIDEKTGIISTDGMDEQCNTYLKHPDSGITYKGWQVPKWKELLATVERVHRNMPKHVYVSWDFSLTDKGWVLIEGNWGEFVCQQMTKKRGYKKDFLTLLN